MAVMGEAKGVASTIDLNFIEIVKLLVVGIIAAANCGHPWCQWKHDVNVVRVIMKRS